MDEFDDYLDYKAAHEAFVSNHNGTSAMEIMAISMTPPLGILISCLFTVLLSSAMKTPSAASTSSSGTTSEFLIVGLPALLCLTCCSDQWHLVLASLTGVCLALLVGTRKIYLTSGGGGSGGKRWQPRLPPYNQIPLAKAETNHYVTNYRASMLFITVLCILAVDFPVFPRRFAKAETFGFGLMDIGVGSFVFSAGLLSSEARKGQEAVSKNRIGHFLTSLKSCVPLLLLGGLRYLSVQGTGYHVHVSEFGLHWNFFFTLAVTKIFSSIIYTTGFGVDWSWFLALGVGVSHEIGLSVGLGKWILDEGPRGQGDLVEANREGLVSSIGFLAIHLAGVAWGATIFKPKSTMKDYTKEAKSLTIWSLVMWASLYYSTESLSMPPSRRLANWPYFTWMVAYNSSLLCLCLLSDLVGNYARIHVRHKLKLSRSSLSSSSKAKGITKQSRDNILRGGSSLGGSNSAEGEEEDEDTSAGGVCARVPLIYRAIAFNSLAYFLLANLLTGAINFSMQTINTQGTPAMLIIIAYMFTLQILSVAFYHKKWKLKMA